MDGAFAPWHIIVLLVIVVLLFGSRRLPGAAKSLGESMHIFKKSVAGLTPDDQDQNAGPNSGFSANTALPPAAPPAQPIATAQQQPDAAQAQLQDLQRQVAELQRQSASETAGQPGQPL